MTVGVETRSASLVQAVKDTTAKVGVIGLGYVGLPLCLAASAAGFSVTGFDIDPAKCDAIAEGRSYLKHIAASSIAEASQSGRFSATTDFDQLKDVDLILVCVPTPLSRHLEPDLSFVVGTAEQIAKRLRPGQTVILESTTYPGTTSEVLQPILETSGLKAGEDFFLLFSPEREDPGNPDFSTTGIPKVVGADSDEARQIGAAFYGKFVNQVVEVSTADTAEAVKLTENIFRAVNIALVNELKLVFEPMGIDVWEVIDAAKTKPFGFMPFYPGPGLGGHCIPIDPFYLTWKAREYGISTRFIELAGQINSRMPQHVVDRLALALDGQQKRGLNGAQILVLGVAYKKNVDDMRESPALRIIELLEERGAQTEYYDPFVPMIPPTREHPTLAGRRSQDWRTNIAADYDAVLVVTDHTDVDYGAIIEHGRLVVDTRNACRKANAEGDNLVLA